MTTASPPILLLSDFAVVPKALLQKLLSDLSNVEHSVSTEGCAAPDAVIDHTYLKDAVVAAESIRGFNTLEQSLRMVEGNYDEGNGEVMLVVPSGLDDEAMVQIMNAAIVEANKATNAGADGGYFEALHEQLAASGVAMQQGIDRLECKPWDDDSMGEDEVSEPPAADPDWVEVEFASENVEGDHLLSLTGKTSAGELVEIREDATVLGFVDALHVIYPRSSRYGIPQCATGQGARDFIREITAFGTSTDFEVVTTDGGDDSPMSFMMKVRVHKDCLQSVEARSEVPRDV
jgi:hypothetical protein